MLRKAQLAREVAKFLEDLWEPIHNSSGISLHIQTLTARSENDADAVVTILVPEEKSP